MIRRFGLWTAAGLCFLAVTPPAGVDDLEELAPVLVILVFGKRVAQLLEVRFRDDRVYEVDDDAGMVGRFGWVGLFGLADSLDELRPVEALAVLVDGPGQVPLDLDGK